MIRRTRLVIGLTLVTLLVAVVAGCSGGSAAAGPYIKPDHRKAAPSLVGTDLSGRPVSLAASRGKLAVVNFWASWCAPCRAESGALRSVAQQERSVRFLGVNEDHTNKRAAISFATQHRLTYPSLWDSQSSAAGDWGLPGLPATFVIDPQGRVAARFFGAVTAGELTSMLQRVQGSDQGTK